MNIKKTLANTRPMMGFLILLLAVSSVFADRTDDLVMSMIAEHHAPGAAVVVIKNGKIIKEKGYGVASVEFNVPVTSDTVFEIGSVSKQMTAAAIMLLVEDGKIGLDEKISKYLPQTPDDWKNVTIRNLMNHTSGIKSYSSLDGFELSKRLKVETFIKQLAEQPMDFETGTQYLYNNSGYNLLAYIIESVSAKPYMEFMKERIFRPLGMNKTGGRDPQFVVLNRAVGYEWRIDRLTGRDGNLTDLMGAGSIISTVSDMAKWAMALRNDTLLKPASKADMWKQNVFNDGKTFPYGLAFRISDIRGHKMIGHTGQTAGFGAAVFRYVNDDVSVVVLTNLGELGLGGQIAAGVAKIYIPSMSLREMRSSGTPADAKTAESIALALKQRLENKPSPEIFSAGLIRTLSTERSKAANSKIAAFGGFREIIFGGQETIDGKVNFRYLAKTDKRLFLWRFVLDTDGKISEMTLEEEE